MGKKNMRNSWWGVGVLIVIWIVFFYKFILLGLYPFPGDLLVSAYQPWKSYSYLEYNPGSYPTKFQYFDTIRQTYPWRVFAIEQLKNGEFPLWNPYNFSGHPLFANAQSAVLYPFNIAFFLLDTAYAWSMLVALQPLLASLFTYLYVRKKGISLLGSIISSIAFGYSLFTSVFLEYNTMIHVILWLPFMLYMVEILRTRWRVGAIIGLTAGTAASAFAGHVQLFALAIVFVALYAFLMTKIDHNKEKIYIGFWKIWGVLFLGLGIAAVQLVPFFELLTQSARVAHESVTMTELLLIQPWQIGLIFIPDLFGNPATANYLLTDSYPGNAMYVGAVSALFALISVAKVSRDRVVKFYAIASLVIILLVVRNPLSEYLFTKVPLLSTSSPGNMLFLLSFCTSVLAGIGMDLWLSGKSISIKSLILIVAVIVGAVFIGLLGGKGVHVNSIVLSGALLAVSSGLLLVGWWVKLKGMGRAFVGIVVVVLLVADLFYFFHKFNSFVPPALVYPDAPVSSYLQKEAGFYRHWGYGSATIESNFATFYRTFSPDGYDPLYPKRYGEFVSLSKEGMLLREFDTSHRSDAAIAPGSGELDLTENKYRLRVLDVLGVKYILDRVENASTQNTFPAVRFGQLYAQDGWVVHENKKVIQRARLVHNFAVVADGKEFEQVFLDESYEPDHTVLLDIDPGITIDSCVSDSSADIIDYGTNTVSIATASECSSVLVLTDTYMPGWQVSVDGYHTSLLRADWTFRGVAVPAGDHEVIFSYEPRSFLYGLIIAITSVLGLATIGFMDMISRKRINHDK